MLEGAILAILLFAGVGCSAIPASAPPPPLAVPIPGGPKEYDFGPVYRWGGKWEPGMNLTYRVETFVEAKSRERTVTQSVQNIMGVRLLEKTAKGHSRIQVSFDNVDLGWILVDRSGEIVDAGSRDHKAAKELLQLMQQPLLKYTPGVLTISKIYQVKVPLREFYPMLLGDQVTIPGFDKKLLDDKATSINYEFTGRKQLGRTYVVTLRVEMPNLLEVPLVIKEDGSLDHMGFAGIFYVDPATEFLVAGYSIWTFSGTTKGERFVLRVIQTITSD